MESAAKSEEERCWCEHLKQWHRLAGICRWCAKMELRHSRFNFMPRHSFATGMPQERHGQAAGAFDRALRGYVNQDDRSPRMSFSARSLTPGNCSPPRAVLMMGATLVIDAQSALAVDPEDSDSLTYLAPAERRLLV